MKPLYIGLIVVGIVILMIVVILIVVSLKNKTVCPYTLKDKFDKLLVELETHKPQDYTSPLGKDVPIYYINLARSPERRKRFEEEVKLYKIQNQVFRVPAVDGKKELTSVFEGDLGDFSFSNRMSKVTFGEAGCTLSHLRAMLEIYKAGHEFALVFEDDVSFALLPFWAKTLNEIIQELPGDAPALHMASLRFGKKTFSPLKKTDVYTCAYLLSRKAIKKLFNRLCPSFETDLHPHFLFEPVKTTHSGYRNQFAADIGLYTRFQPSLFTEFPTFITQNDAEAFNSTIHPTHTYGHIKGSIRAIEFYTNSFLDKNK